DERMDFGHTVAMFNSNEVLTHVGMKGSFPVGDRDFSLLSNLEIDSATETVYYASRSVEDPLIAPDPNNKRIRCELNIAGWILHRRKSRPAPTSLSTVEPVNPVKSRMRACSRPPPILTSPRFLMKSHDVYAPPVSPVHIDAPCVQVTYVVQIDLRGSVPQTLINTLAMQLPQCIATVSSYASKFGFPPYFERHNIKQGITVLTEEFEHKLGTYNLIYKVDCGLKEPVTQVRFCKTMFREGYEVEVKRAKEWKMVEDVDGKGITLLINNSGMEGVPTQVRISKKKKIVKRRVVAQQKPATPIEALLVDWPMPPARDNNGVVTAIAQ
ncbi:2336_t:CDS:2, partial [Paraglomus brasilianum]